MPFTRPLNRSKNISIEGINTTFAVNICLLSLFVISIFYYVISANAITSAKFGISSLNSELSAINQANSELITFKTEAEDSNAVVLFAQRNNMVEAKTVAHIFEGNNVALQR